jgi:hypothetical protein
VTDELIEADVGDDKQEHDSLKALRLRTALFVTDAELIRRLGVPEKIMRRNLREFDTKPNYEFPKKSKVYGDRRYWPAVVQYFDRMNMVGAFSSLTTRDQPR